MRNRFFNEWAGFGHIINAIMLLAALVTLVFIFTVGDAMAQAAVAEPDTFIGFEGFGALLVQTLSVIIGVALPALIGWALMKIGIQRGTETHNLMQERISGIGYVAAQAGLVKLGELASTIRLNVHNDFIAKIGNSIINEIGPKAVEKFVGPFQQPPAPGVPWRNAKLEELVLGLLAGIQDDEARTVVVANRSADSGSPALPAPA